MIYLSDEIISFFSRFKPVNFPFTYKLIKNVLEMFLKEAEVAWLYACCFVILLYIYLRYSNG